MYWFSCKENLKVFFIPHRYPSEEMYKTGVSCGILKAERDNPNAKVFQTFVRAQANKLLEENGYYEVLLVNRENCITEGSRSNVFLGDGGKIVTPSVPKVLLGITRSKVIQCIMEMILLMSPLQTLKKTFLGWMLLVSSTRFKSKFIYCLK